MHARRFLSSIVVLLVAILLLGSAGGAALAARPAEQPAAFADSVLVTVGRTDATTTCDGIGCCAPVGQTALMQAISFAYTGHFERLDSAAAPLAPADAGSIWIRNNCASAVTFYVWDRMYKYPTGGWVNGTGALITIPGNSDAEWIAPLGWPAANEYGSQDLLIYRCERANGGSMTAANYVGRVWWTADSAICQGDSEWRFEPDVCSTTNTQCCGTGPTNTPTPTRTATPTYTPTWTPTATATAPDGHRDAHTDQYAHAHAHLYPHVDAHGDGHGHHDADADSRDLLSRQLRVARRGPRRRAREGRERAGRADAAPAGPGRDRAGHHHNR